MKKDKDNNLCPRMREILGKALFDMDEMVKVLYDERTTWFQGESSNKKKVMVVMGASLHLLLLLHLLLYLHPHFLHIELLLLHLQMDMLSLLCLSLMSSLNYQCIMEK